MNNLGNQLYTANHCATVRSYSNCNEKPIVTFDATEMFLGQKLSNRNGTLEKVFPPRSTDTDDNSRQKQLKSVVSEKTNSQVS
jgi:hypothetical protein